MTQTTAEEHPSTVGDELGEGVSMALIKAARNPVGLSLAGQPGSTAGVTPAGAQSLCFAS